MIGHTILHYTVLEKLGEGGMGVVYKAEDTKLKRMVALKFLPANASASEQDKARFTQEAQSASALNHPNVCTIHDIQEYDGQMFIVMEFVEGKTLREMRESLTSKQAMDIGIQIADGLAAAHEKGIIHRDIKPENVMVRKDGIVQVMDFGLAKLRGSISRLTKEGSTVGTAGYMSPEQVQGHDADQRSDIFSFGVLLYELFTGQLPFRGVHETALMYEIVNVDAAPMSTLKPEIDAGLDAIVLECLEKDPRDRYQSVAEVGKDLRKFKRESSRTRVSRVTAARPVYQSSAAQPLEHPEPIEPPKRSAPLIPWLIAGLFAVALLGLAFIHFREPAPDVPVLRSYIHPPDKVTLEARFGGHIALSPDGRTLAFVGRDTVGKTFLFVQPLRSLIALQLPGTDDAIYPFWSPDNKQIAFFSSGRMKRVDATGGPVLTICDAPNGRGGTWNSAGTILFAPDNTSGLSKVSAAGGTPAVVTSVDSSRREDNHRWPLFLPDGVHFLYSTQTTGAGGASEQDRILAGSLSDTSYRTELFHASSNMAFVRGHLLYYQQKALMARPFDPEKISFSGDAVPIAENVLYGSPRSKASFTASGTGILLYQGGFTSLNRLVYVDRSGREVQSLAEGPSLTNARLSPDEKMIAYSQEDQQTGTLDIWMSEIARGVRTRFTFDPSTEGNPVWSPDGISIAYSWNRGARAAIYMKSAITSDTAHLLYSSSANNIPTSWSSDGKSLAFFSTGDAKTKVDLWILPLSGDHTPVSFLKTQFTEVLGRFSADQRWLAYMSDESGQFEVYIRSIANSGAWWQVSKSGGSVPLWRRDGKEIYFISQRRKVTAVDIKASPSGIEIGAEHELFDLDAHGPAQVTDVTADGSKFLVFVAPAGLTQPVTMVTNWDSELMKK
jgi:Tol biopolymer transport system component/predicted Ser/Thr protein kinase